jgi:hypothetical protein
MVDQTKGQWFLRLPTDIVSNPFIMDNSSAADWRVLLAIAKHQGYKNRRTFPIYVAKTAEEARCCRRQALMSIDWWTKVGVLLKTKKRRVNAYEIAQHFQLPPGIGARQRHNTPRNPNRGKNGRYVPLACTGKVQTKGTIMVQTKGTLNQKSSSEVFSENPPSVPPQGGDGHASETSARPTLPSPNIIISKETIKEWKRLWGPDKLRRYLEDHGYPLYSLQEEEEKPSPRGEEKTRE